MKNKMTPEQIEERNRVLAARYAAQEEDKRKAREARRVAYADQLQAMKAKAAEYKKTEANDVFDVKVAVLAEISFIWLDAQDEMEAWSENFNTVPGYAFEWATSTMQAAAKRSFLDIFFTGNRDATQAAVYLVGNLEDGLLNNRWRASSTSASSNAYELAKAAAAAALLPMARRWKQILA